MRPPMEGQTFVPGVYRAARPIPRNRPTAILLVDRAAHPDEFDAGHGDGFDVEDVVGAGPQPGPSATAGGTRRAFAIW